MRAINGTACLGLGESGTSTYLRDMSKSCECESDSIDLRCVAVRYQQFAAVISGPAQVSFFRGSRLCLGGRLHSLAVAAASACWLTALLLLCFQKVLTWLCLKNLCMMPTHGTGTRPCTG